MANKPGQSDTQIHERLDAVARDCSARLGEHFEGIVVIAAYRDSFGRQRATTWIDGGEYAGYAAAKDYVIRAEERMRLGTFAPGEIDPPADGWQESEA